MNHDRGSPDQRKRGIRRLSRQSSGVTRSPSNEVSAAGRKRGDGVTEVDQPSAFWGVVKGMSACTARAVVRFRFTVRLVARPAARPT